MGNGILSGVIAGEVGRSISHEENIERKDIVSG